MKKTLADHLAAERRRRGISARQLSTLAGYKRIAQGERRILRFEKSGDASRPFIERLFAALGLSLHAIERDLQRRVIRRHERLLARWLRRYGDDPPPKLMVVRCFAGCYGSHDLTGRVTTTAEAVEYARSFARRWSHQVMMPLDGQWKVHFDEQGRVVSVHAS
jgi:transcriptional regulator with XRE-family HTH domain